MARVKPKKYKKQFPQMLIEHMSEGLSFKSFGAIAEVSYKTLFVWRDRYKEFGEAKEIGEAKSLLWWEKMGRHGAAGKIKNFNVSAWIFAIKNQHKWTDRSDLRIEAKIEDNEQFSLLRAVPREKLIALARGGDTIDINFEETNDDARREPK